MPARRHARVSVRLPRLPTNPSDPPPGPSAPPGPGLVWSDEFNGPAGAQPDPSRWSYDTGRWRDGGELEYYTDRTQNVAMDGQGSLRISARREWYRGASYTSGRIVTRDRFEPQYGRIEARIKVPAGRGLLPAFWMLGRGAPWPAAGEIDVMEVTGNDPFTWWGHLHGPSRRSSRDDASESRERRSSTRFSDGFHVFAADWRPGSIQFSVDGEAAGAPLTPATYASNGGEWVYDRPLYLLLNVAVGNRWTGPPWLTTRWPATMLVDWVRVYS